MADDLVYYHSVVSSRTTEDRVKIYSEIDARLLTTHDSNRSNLRLHLPHLEGSTVTKLLLDSGAFTAWNIGKPMTVDRFFENTEYALSLIPKSWKGELYFISLDVIPGVKGQPTTQSQIEEAVAQSDENHEVIVKRYGRDRVLPVFHQQESFERLEEVVRVADGYICVSPLNSLHEAVRVKWADEVHAYLGRNHPTIRTHGLATTGHDMMSTVPFYSVDSATLTRVAGFGQILLVTPSGMFKKIAISEGSPRLRNEGEHVLNMDESVRDLVRRRMAEYSIELESLQTDLVARFMFNLNEMNRWLRDVYKRPAFECDTEGFFDL